MGKSSKDKRDAYYRLAKEQGWRARSAFKLLQLDEEFDIFGPEVTRVVDLCAAPGSWSQVLSRVLVRGEKFGRAAWDEKQADLRAKITDTTLSDDNTHVATQTPNILDPAVHPQNDRKPRDNVKIVALDLQPMSPLEGVTTLQADITHPSTIPRVLEALGEDPDAGSTVSPLDLLICDGAPDVTGLHDLDIYVQSQLLAAALSFAFRLLKRNPRRRLPPGLPKNNANEREDDTSLASESTSALPEHPLSSAENQNAPYTRNHGGTFIAKIFRAKDVDLLYAQFSMVFNSVIVAKPRASRATSLEAFIVCRDFNPPVGMDGSTDLGFPLGQAPVQPVHVRSKTKTHQVRSTAVDGIVDLDIGASESDREEDMQEKSTAEELKAARWIAPFLACGDLDAFDSDATYVLPEGHISLDPVQPPTAPPYKKALEMKRDAGQRKSK